MARYTDDSKERVRDAVDMVDLVGARTELQARRAPTATGPVPVPRGAHAVVRHQPGQEGLPLLRLPGAGRRFTFVRRPRASTSSARSSCWPTATGSSSRSRTRTPRRPSAASAASGCSSCSSAPPRSTCATCGSPTRRRRPASTCAAAGWRRRSCASSASATRRAPGTRCCMASRRAGFGDRELYDAGLAQRAQGAAGRSTTASAGGSSFPLADPRGRVLGFGARALGDDQQPKYLNTPRERALPQGPPALRRRPRAGGAPRRRAA